MQRKDRQLQQPTKTSLVLVVVAVPYICCVACLIVDFYFFNFFMTTNEHVIFCTNVMYLGNFIVGIFP